MKRQTEMTDFGIFECFSVQSWSHESPRPAENYYNELRVLMSWGNIVSWDVPTGSFLNIGSSSASSALESRTGEENQVTCSCLWFITVWIVFFTMLGNKTMQINNGDGKCSSLFVSFRLLYFPLCCQIGAAWRYLTSRLQVVEPHRAHLSPDRPEIQGVLMQWEASSLDWWTVRWLQTDMRVFQALTTEWTKFYFNSELPSWIDLPLIPESPAQICFGYLREISEISDRGQNSQVLFPLWLN